MLSRILSHSLLQVGVELVEELIGGEPWMIRADQDRQVARHLSTLDGVDTDPFEAFGEANDIGGFVEGAAIPQAARPGEDRGDRIGRSLPSLLMLAAVARDPGLPRPRL